MSGSRARASFDRCWNDVRNVLRVAGVPLTLNLIHGCLTGRYGSESVRAVLRAMRIRQCVARTYHGKGARRYVHYEWVGPTGEDVMPDER